MLVFKNSPKEFFKDVWSAKWKFVIIFLISTFALFHWGAASAVLWAIFLIFILYDYNSNVLTAVAVVALMSCPALLWLSTHGFDFDFEAAAEQMAIYAFFFLAMSVAIQIVDLKRYPDTYDQKN